MPGATYLIHASREAMLRLLPRNGVVAEVGVAEGEFSQNILRCTLPQQLHLIDVWRRLDVEAYQVDPANVPDADQEDRYQMVRHRFLREIRQGRVQVHRALSVEAAAGFPPAFFDWVYIDAMHTYDAVLADLLAYYPLVKPDGFLCGHDYANHPSARQMNFGVVEAVNEFAKQTGCHFAALTTESHASFILAKDIQSANFRMMEAEMFEHFMFIKVYEFLERRFQHEVVVERRSGRARVFPAIG